MANDFIHPNAATGYAANEAVALGRTGQAYFNQLTKVFGILSHTSVQAPADYAAAAAAFGITTTQAETMWNLLNGAIQAWNGTGTNANNNNLINLVG